MLELASFQKFKIFIKVITTINLVFNFEDVYQTKIII